MESTSTIATTVQNSNLMVIAVAVLTTREEETSQELMRLKEMPMPSKEGWDKGDIPPEENNIKGRIKSAEDVLKKIRPALDSLRRAINNGVSFNVCQLCGVLFCWPRIMEYWKKEEPKLEIPCLHCEKVTKTR